jgi:hypothetical protein
MVFVQIAELSMEEVERARLQLIELEARGEHCSSRKRAQ